MYAHTRLHMVVYLHVCTHMCGVSTCILCVCVCTHMPGWSPEIDVWCLPLLLSTFLLERGSLIEPGTHQFSPTKAAVTMPGFLCGLWNLNSDPHVCVTSAFFIHWVISPASRNGFSLTSVESGNQRCRAAWHSMLIRERASSLWCPWYPVPLGASRMTTWALSISEKEGGFGSTFYS